MLLRFSSLILIGWVLLWGCKPLDERLDPNPGKGLRFSADTVLFDTVFTEQKTITLRLRVYNDNSGTITLTSVALEKGAGSPFSFLLNGQKGPVQNIEILGNDSAYVLVSGTLPASRVLQSSCPSPLPEWPDPEHNHGCSGLPDGIGVQNIPRPWYKTGLFPGAAPG